MIAFYKKNRGEVALAIALGILAFTVFFSFWRIHGEEKQVTETPMGGVEEKCSVCGQGGHTKSHHETVQ